MKPPLPSTLNLPPFVQVLLYCDKSTMNLPPFVWVLLYYDKSTSKLSLRPGADIMRQINIEFLPSS